MACLWISPRNPWGLIVDLKFIIAKLVEISIKYGLYLYGRALLALMTLILSGGYRNVIWWDDIRALLRTQNDSAKVSLKMWLTCRVEIFPITLVSGECFRYPPKCHRPFPGAQKPRTQSFVKRGCRPATVSSGVAAHHAALFRCGWILVSRLKLASLKFHFGMITELQLWKFVSMFVHHSFKHFPKVQHGSGFAHLGGSFWLETLSPCQETHGLNHFSELWEVVASSPTATSRQNRKHGRKHLHQPKPHGLK